MRIWILTLFLGIFILNYAYAQEAINIGQTQIPIMEGAKSIQNTAAQPARASIVTYTMGQSLDSVIEFYESFFKNNAYLIIGGKKDAEYNVSLKKENVMFTLRIYASGGKTIIQFIW